MPATITLGHPSRTSGTRITVSLQCQYIRGACTSLSPHTSLRWAGTHIPVARPRSGGESTLVFRRSGPDQNPARALLPCLLHPLFSKPRPKPHTLNPEPCSVVLAVDRTTFLCCGSKQIGFNPILLQAPTCKVGRHISAEDRKSSVDQARLQRAAAVAASNTRPAAVRRR